MKIREVRAIAKPWHVDAGVGRSKQDIIRDIQVKEGNSPCFKTKVDAQARYFQEQTRVVRRFKNDRPASDVGFLPHSEVSGQRPEVGV